MTSRSLTGPEKEIIWQVFRQTLPSDQVFVTDGLGLGGRPYCNPNPNLLQGGYLMNVGPTNYGNLSSSRGRRRLLVHEATHVWQGIHGVFPLAYVFNSALCQSASIVMSGSASGAYEYMPGASWMTYSAEQQANIVRDWYDAGRPTSGSLWPYIRDHIRQP